MSLRAGKIISATFVNVATYELVKDIALKISIGDISVDFSFAGAVYDQ